MLEVLNVTRSLPRPSQEALTILNQISFAVPKGHLMAVIGAPGSGRTSLIRLLAGLDQASEGVIAFYGKDTALHPVHPNSIGVVTADDDGLSMVLTVRETLMSALMLRVSGQTDEARIAKASHILVGVGLETLASARVSALSISQRRRLKLALALVSDAPLVLCDEFTDGLDVKSEQELTALLKFIVTDQPGRMVVHATQSVANIASYDTVVILHEGHVCFHGPARAVAHYFSIANVEELYPRLAKRPAERWGDSWSRHRESYYEAFKLGDLGRSMMEPITQEDLSTDTPENDPALASPKSNPSEITAAPEPPALPSLMQQTSHLIRRRWSIFRRTQSEWLEHLVLILVLPLLAMLLVAPNTVYLSAISRGDSTPEFLWPAAYTCAMALFIQTLLILIMSVRNGAREIAAERPLLERERRGGLRISAYLLSKLGFLIPLVAAQGFALGLLVEITGCSLPGNGFARLILLVLTGIAFSSLCLGISAHSRNSENAQNHAWRLVIFNILVCGALLGMPRLIGGFIQPLTTAYYGWSGSVETLKTTSVFVPMTHFVRTWFATPTGAMLALTLHTFIGLTLALTGLKKAR